MLLSKWLKQAGISDSELLGGCPFRLGGGNGETHDRRRVETPPSRRRTTLIAASCAACGLVLPHNPRTLSRKTYVASGRRYKPTLEPSRCVSRSAPTAGYGHATETHPVGRGR